VGVGVGLGVDEAEAEAEADADVPSFPGVVPPPLHADKTTTEATKTAAVE
jgi:hypothetical protein